jgi:hypothetical protein
MRDACESLRAHPQSRAVPRPNSNGPPTAAAGERVQEQRLPGGREFISPKAAMNRQNPHSVNKINRCSSRGQLFIEGAPVTSEAKVLRNKAARALRHGRKVKHASAVFKEVAATYKRLALQEEQSRGECRKSSKR